MISRDGSARQHLCSRSLRPDLDQFSAFPSSEKMNHDSAPQRSARVRASWALGLAGTGAHADKPAATTPGEAALHLESVTLPAPLLENGKSNVVIEASAVEPIGDGRRLLVAHDKNPALFIVETATGRILGDPITSPRFPQIERGRTEVGRHGPRRRG